MLTGTLYEATWMLKVHLHMIYVYFVCGDPGCLRIEYTCWISLATCTLYAIPLDA